MEDNDLLKVRLEKIAALKAAGVDLYPNNIQPQNTTAELCAQFDNYDGEALAQLTQSFSIAGRLMAAREMRVSFWTAPAKRSDDGAFGWQGSSDDQKRCRSRSADYHRSPKPGGSSGGSWSKKWWP